MEDISARIGEILSSPEQMQNIQKLASMLGLGGLGGGENPPPPPSCFPPSQPEQAGGSADSLFGAMDPAMVTSLIGLVNRAGKLEKEDKGIALLRALKPLLSEERSRRVDDAARLLVLARMFPLLRESGLLPAVNL